LHARYTKDNLGDDLVFRTAPAIAGGREHLRDGVKLEEGAVEESYNNFQGRYAVRHPWTGPIKCANPRRGVWGGPPNGQEPRPQPALNLAFATRNKAGLPGYLAKGTVPETAFAALGGPGPLPPPVALPAPTAVTAPVTSSSAEPAPSSVASAAPDAGSASPKPVEPNNRGCGCNQAPASGSVVLVGVAALVLGLVRRRRS
jgi:hypothetical protein